MITPALQWGASTASLRGPIVACRPSEREGNAIGAHSGPYALYKAVAMTTGAITAGHRPDLADTEPNVSIGPFPQWRDPYRIVSLDPWGHRVGSDFECQISRGEDIRPTIAVTQGRLRIPEIAAAMVKRRLAADGEILFADGAIYATKISIDPVWWLPGVAARLHTTEEALREGLYRLTGGMFSALVARPEIKVFLPPIAGSTVYLFGDAARLGDPRSSVTCRIHDECNASDVFGSEMCTCRPYLGFGIEQAILAGQKGGIGLIIYNRNEGRALGELVKFLVYNARGKAASGDQPEAYFDRTRRVAGTHDCRLQELAVDTLHWLGITHIDRWISMSNLKRDALSAAGISVGSQFAIPDDLIPAGAHVEIEAKTAGGYFSDSPRRSDHGQTAHRCETALVGS
jgi:GTP cyclohydrolase II